IAVDPGPSPSPSPSPSPGTSFSDVQGDIYAQQIARAVDIGFIAGFEDNTFRPQTALTREQLVSMVLEALDAQDNLSIALPNQVSSAPFRDVPSNRWSAAKIQFANQAGIVTGYPDGTFRPAQQVTRAEMIAVLRRAAEYRKSLLNEGTTLNPTQTAFNFSDTSGHWAADVISDLSAYCGIATPVNESGSAFAPNSDALRNYAATAVVRLVDCPNP
ncbi:MAG: S-layer homology domain-containing protein, partial [Cyanobacteria bacterium J06629_9]